MSEVLGTVLLTGMTVVLLGGFSAVVLSTVMDSTEPPTATFRVAAEDGARSVDVTHVTGASFALAEARFVLLVNGDSSGGGVTIIQGDDPNRFTPGNVLRVDLAASAPDLALDDSVSFLAVDEQTGGSIGRAWTTILGPATTPAVRTNTLTMPSVTLTPSTVPADGVTLSTVSATVGARFGNALVKEVWADLAALGGPTRAVLTDDGDGGDAAAADGVYTLQFAAPARTFSSSDGSDVVTVAVTATDGLGQSVTGTADLTLTAPTPDRVGPGARYRDLPSSATAGRLALTDFAFADASALVNDKVRLRIADASLPSVAWTAVVAFDACGSTGAGVAGVTFQRDGLANPASYTPPGSCFELDADAELDLLDPDRSTDAGGGTATWTRSGAADTHEYPFANVGAANEGIVTFAADGASTDPGDTGFGHATLAWAVATNAPPVLSWTHTEGGLTVHADASGTTDPEGEAMTYAWDWGDGASGTGVTASHTYAAAGTFTVRLTVTDASGGVATDTDAVIVDGITTFRCPPTSDPAGALSDCASLHAEDASGAGLAEAKDAANDWVLDVQLTGDGVAGAASASHDLFVTARQENGPDAESLAVDVWDPDAGAWRALAAVALTTTYAESGPFALTDAEWQDGAPLVRFRSDGDAKRTHWSVDRLWVVTS